MWLDTEKTIVWYIANTCLQITTAKTRVIKMEIYVLICALINQTLTKNGDNSWATQSSDRVVGFGGYHLNKLYWKI